MNRTTEFLMKSLVGAGVFLAVPAAALMLVALFAAVISFPYFREREFLSSLTVFLFCSLGLFLLLRTIRFVRAAHSEAAPAWLWPVVTLYLLTIIAGGLTWLIQSYSAARAGEWRSWGGDEIDPEILIAPAIALLLPVWAVVLSSTLWVRYALNRNV